MIENVGSMSLGVGDSGTYVFSSTEDFSATGPYTLTVFVSLLGDQYTPNDTIFSEI